MLASMMVAGALGKEDLCYTAAVAIVSGERLVIPIKPIASFPAEVAYVLP